MPSSSISASPTRLPCGSMTPDQALFGRDSNSRFAGRSADIAAMISSLTAEQATIVKTLPSKLCAGARRRRRGGGHPVATGGEGRRVHPGGSAGFDRSRGAQAERKNGGEGKRVAGMVDLGGWRELNKKQ